MSGRTLAHATSAPPEHPNFEHLKKQGRQRLRGLTQASPGGKLVTHAVLHGIGRNVAVLRLEDLGAAS